MFESPLSISAHLTACVVNSDQVLLLSEAGDKYLLRGSIYRQLIPLLDGSKNALEISKMLSHVPPERVYYALTVLYQKRYVAELNPSIPYPEAAFWSGLRSETLADTESVANTPISVIALGDTQEDRLALLAALHHLGIRETSENEAQLVVVTLEDYLQSPMRTLNRRLRTESRFILPVKAVGQFIWFGPLFSPTKSPCWECMSRRIRENRAEETLAQSTQDSDLILSKGHLFSTRSTAINLVATEIAKWAAQGRTSSLEDVLITLDTESLEMARHKVLSLPDCSLCSTTMSNTTSLEDTQLVLRSQQATYASDGGYRICSPDITFAKVEHHVSPITGIVPQLVSGQPLQDVHVYWVNQNSPTCGGSGSGRLGKRDSAAGKGETKSQAKISCVAEAIERYCTMYRGDEPRLQSSWLNLEQPAIHPGALINFSKRQYGNRDQWNLSHTGFNWVPEPFDESAETDWTPNWSLTHQEIRYLPTAFCFLRYSSSLQSRYCQGDSNGCASGNTLEEAVLQGLLELVERDSMALYWYNRAPRPAIDLATFDHGFFDSMIARYRSRNRTLVVLDITSDLQIPVVAAVSSTLNGGQILFGLGAHLDIKVAISRAISEINQMEPISDTWGRLNTSGKPMRSDDKDINDWMANATVTAHDYLVPVDGEVRGRTDYARFAERDILLCVESCIDRIHSQDLEVLVLNVTRKDVGFPTVRVTVPGLRHFWARFGPGRLYDVPVKLGWIPHQLAEKELNPVPFFL
jgi:oxazoline/thiazoline synthase